MRFLRHLIAATVVVACICAAALLSGLGGQPGRPAIFCPHGCDPASVGLAAPGVALRHKLVGPVAGAQPPHLDLANLVQTVVLGTVIALVVIAVDVVVRRRRRSRRMTARRAGIPTRT
jgi:hypothetical protein